MSDKILTKEEKELLGLGLEFCLPPPKVNYFKHFLGFERLCSLIKDCSKYGDTNLNSIFRDISSVANNSFRIYNKEVREVSRPDLTDILKNLKEDPNLLITKPDKGRGVVLMNKCDYDDKIHIILDDTTKFKYLSIDLESHLLKLEDKLNRILRDIRSNIGDVNFRNLYTSGSRPGKLYGLPKVHKTDNPLRPIISSIGTFNYNLAKFLVPMIAPFTKNEFTVENSNDFVEQLLKLDLSGPAVMASIDVESLFTNVPLKETTNLIVNYISDNNNPFNLPKRILTKLFTIATSDSVFTFNNKIYTQVDGVAMGSPVGPSYANAFLCHYEKIWLDNCPPQFKPIFYRRYIDDTFLLFKESSHLQEFLSYMNSRHDNIKFTSEMENNSKLAFLDTIVLNENGKFSTSVYRKPTFSGLGLNFLSFCPKIFKTNSIKTLINRAYKICSSYKLFDVEMKYLLNYFQQNSYMSSTFYRILNAFLDNKFSPKVQISTAPKDIRYVKLPFYGNESFAVRKRLNNILRDSFPQINFRFVFTNTFTIGSYLKKSTPLCFGLRSSVIYLFSCPSCSARYVGSTSRWIKHRISDHLGRSFRTGLPLSNPQFSAIREHSHNSDHLFTHTDFEILGSTPFRSDLLTLESLYITKLKPELNGSMTAGQLYTQ